MVIANGSRTGTAIFNFKVLTSSTEVSWKSKSAIYKAALDTWLQIPADCSTVGYRKYHCNTTFNFAFRGNKIVYNHTMFCALYGSLNGLCITMLGLLTQFYLQMHLCIKSKGKSQLLFKDVRRANVIRSFSKSKLFHLH